MRRVHVGLVGIHGLPVLVEIEQARILDALVEVVVDVPLLSAGRWNQRLQRIAESLLLTCFARMWAITVTSSGRWSVGVVTSVGVATRVSSETSLTWSFGVGDARRSVTSI